MPYPCALDALRDPKASKLAKYGSYIPPIEKGIYDLPKNKDGITFRKSNELTSKLNDLIALGLATQENARYYLNQRLYGFDRTNLYAHNFGLDDPLAAPDKKIFRG